jgi:MFS family permease
MSASNASSPLLSRPMLALYAISLCSGVALSTFALLTSTWMEQAGIAKFVIGLVGAAYYAFQIVGGPLAERLLRRRDARFALALGLLIAAIASPSFVLTKSAACLWLVRALAGVGVGITVTVGQTLLLARTAPAQRGSASGLHALGFALGMALGPAIGTPLYQLSPALAAGFGASVLLAGFATSTLLPGGTLPLQPGRQRVAAKLTLPLHGIFAYGFAESALFALYPAVLVQGGMRVSQIGIIFLCFVVGSIVATLPLTRLGDVIGRRRVLSGCVLVGTATVLALLWAPTYPLVLACATIAGGAVGSSYALNVALVGDALSAEELPSGMALFTIALGLGCVAGPLVTGATVAAFGGAATFIPTAVVFAALLARLAYPGFAAKPVAGLRGGA